MKLKNKVILASAVLGLALSNVTAQTAIPLGNEALLAGYDFNNKLSGNFSTAGSRVSDVWGNTSALNGVAAAGGMFFNGTNGSEAFTSISGAGVANNTGEDVDRDIRTRPGTGSTFDLGGQTGNPASLWFNGASVGGASMNEFSILVHSLDAVNAFNSLEMDISGRDIDTSGGTAAGVTINWGYRTSLGGPTVSTGLSTTFDSNVFAQQSVDFSAITAMNALADLWIIGEIVESGSAAVLSLDNIGIYGNSFTAIPEPSTYAAILGAMALGVSAIRRRRAALSA